MDEARAFLAMMPDRSARVQRVTSLIEGFETPLGMELLGTVHWVMQHEAPPDDIDAVIAQVHAWSGRKRSQMKDGQIRAAWRRLREQRWVARSS